MHSLPRIFLRTRTLFPSVYSENTICSSSQMASSQKMPFTEGSFLTQGYAPFQKKPTSNKWTMRGTGASPLPQFRTPLKSHLRSRAPHIEDNCTTVQKPSLAILLYLLPYGYFSQKYPQMDLLHAHSALLTCSHSSLSNSLLSGMLKQCRLILYFSCPGISHF